MHAMQYKIQLPNDYDMKIIKQRVLQNGYKTDGFKDLLLKAYLIINSPSKKEYSPLYIWKEEQGMNDFIFNGFYDNILSSFGWQHINIAIPIIVDLDQQLTNSRFVVEIEHTIQSSLKMELPKLSFPACDCLGKILVYNPDKWKYVEFYFLESMDNKIAQYGTTYEILHLSS